LDDLRVYHESKNADDDAMHVIFQKTRVKQEANVHGVSVGNGYIQKNRPQFLTFKQTKKKLNKRQTATFITVYAKRKTFGQSPKNV